MTKQRPKGRVAGGGASTSSASLRSAPSPQGEGKKNLRKLHCTVTAQTMYHLEQLAAAAGYREVGRVVDKLVREKAMQLKERDHGKKL